MKKTSVFFAAAAALALVGTAAAQTTLDLNWKIDFGTPAAQGMGIDDNTRGMGLDPVTGNLLVATRSGGNRILALNPADGSLVGTLADSTPSVFTGGTFVLNKVVADTDGVIYVTNLAIQGGNFKLYTTPNLATVPTVGLDVSNIPARLGDDVAILGSGASLQIVVTGSGNPGFSVITPGITPGTFQIANVTASPALAGIPNVAFVPGTTDQVAMRSALSPARPAQIYNVNTGAQIGSDIVIPGGSWDNATATGFANFGPHIPFVRGTSTFLAIAPGNVGGLTSTPVVNNQVPFVVFDLADLTAPAFVSERNLGPGTGNSTDWGSNGNGAGDVIFDAVNDRIYNLSTRNSISSWSFPATSVIDWNTLQ